MTEDSKLRSIRTAITVVVSVCLALPTSLAAVDVPDKYRPAIAGTVVICGLVVAVVTPIKLALEDAGIIRAFFRPKGDVNGDQPPPA